MSVQPSENLQRRQIIVRIDENRNALGETLQRLGRPLKSVQVWRDRAVSAWPWFSGLLLITGVIWVCLRAMRGRGPAAAGTRKLAWLVLLQQAMNAYRMAMQLRDLVNAAGMHRRFSPTRAMPVADAVLGRWENEGGSVSVPRSNSDIGSR